MKSVKPFFLLLLIIASVISGTSIYQDKIVENNEILAYVVDLKKQSLALYWKNDQGEIMGNFGRLNQHIEAKGEKLVFAMNAGMFQKNHTPLGLYIENGKVLKKINTTKEAYGNFYLQPNGVFYITNDNVGVVCKRTDFNNKNVKYATQSGPMLLIDGEIHPRLTKGSKNLNIRNGVGVLPDGKLLFAMSKHPINFYDFASYFKANGCKNALYLDGSISKTYLPEDGWNDMEGKFGVLIGETKKH